MRGTVRAEVKRVVERRKAGAFLDARHHRLVHHHGRAEVLAAVDDAMSDRFDLLKIMDRAVPFAER